jgi:hypothetical protein
VKRLGRRGKIPGRLPIRQHLYLRDEVDKWLRGEQREAPEKSKEVTIEQDLYQETDHKRKIRELARTLSERILIPISSDEVFSQDFPLDFQKGKYNLSFGGVDLEQKTYHRSFGQVDIDDKKQVKVTYHDLFSGLAEPHLVEGLKSHLRTSQLPEYQELMRADGKLISFQNEAGRYTELLLNFLRVIADEVQRYDVSVNFKDDTKLGLTRHFILTVWDDAIKKAIGHSGISDSWYEPPQSAPDKGIWYQDVGASRVAVSDNKEELQTYVEWHKELRAKYAQDQNAKEIAEKERELSQLAQDIRQRLRKFSDTRPLLGHCGLCKPNA